MDSPTGYLMILFLTFSMQLSNSSPNYNSRRTIELEGGPSNVVWVVQLSDLHFSVHHPERALSFGDLVPPLLAMINPALVLITGDLTDGKSKDLLTMKQDEKEWIEYSKTMKETIEKSGLQEDIFYDLHGNHDKFGVPLPKGHFDFFLKYSINAYSNRTGNVNSVTLLNNGWKHLLVGLDSAMSIGLRGPTNLFGHPTDKMISELDAELSQWDTQQSELITKIVFGHFPLSFSAATETGKRLEDIFAKHGLSAYLCGHLHTKFGKNLQRHYSHLPHLFKTFERYFQLNAHFMTIDANVKDFCNLDSSEEFWEWEMGDWRKNRMMRIIAIDDGHASFVDFNASIAMPTLIVPTFPLDSRMMQRISSFYTQECRSNDITSHETIRTLVFSATPIISVKAKIFDSMSGNFDLIMETKMVKHSYQTNRGDLYVAQWDWQRFIDPSSNRYWLQIETVDSSGKQTDSQVRPFSVNFKAAPLRWTWKEFWVLGCHWDSLYEPLFWAMISYLLALLLVPKILLSYVGNRYQFKRWTSSNWKCLSNILFQIPLWMLMEGSKISLIWWGQMLHLLYLIFFPWFSGHVLVEDYDIGYMYYKGWTVKLPEPMSSQSGLGVPDLFMIVLPHLYFVVFPLLWVVSAFAAERVACQMHYLLKSEKKEEEASLQDTLHNNQYFFKNYAMGCTASCIFCGRWIRKALQGVCLILIWDHWKRCKALIHAYGAETVLSSVGFVWPVPLLLALAVWKTKGWNDINSG